MEHILNRQRSAIIGSFVHSINFGELEVIDNGILEYNDEGIIENIVDRTKTPVSDEYMSQFKHVFNFSGKLIVPGLIDAHCHAPQYVFSGTGMDLPLLAWLEKHTFPCEARFSDADFARMAYAKSIRRHLKCGTTFASYFATIHNEAGKILIDVINKVGQRAFVGKVSMDRNCPDFYIEETQTGCDDAEEFVQYALSQSATGREFLRSIGCSVLGGESCKRQRVLANDISSLHSAPLSSASSATSDDNSKRYRAVSNISNYEEEISAVFPSTMEASEDELAWSCSVEARHQAQDLQYSSLLRESLASASIASADDAATTTNSSSSSSSVDLWSCPFKQRPTLLNKPHTPLVMPCVTPRFVPTCTPVMMTRLGELSLRYGLPVQSHLSESMGEIDWVSTLHPDCNTYADVYDKYGLLHSNAYMAHCCHSSKTERAVLASKETGVVHCASSNFMLSSGVMDVRAFVNEGIKVALGTDVAGGYSPSMLDAIRQCIVASRVKGFDHKQIVAVAEGTAKTSPIDAATLKTEQDSDSSSSLEYDTLQLSANYRSLSYAEAFHLATVGGAEVLGMDKVVGNFMVGKKLDCLVVNVNVANSPIDTFEGEGVIDHFQKFLFLGDDRNVESVFVNGVKVI